MAETSVNNPQLIPPNPTKFYTHFLYKAIFVSIFLLLLPLFPAQTPNFINHSINTTSWELVQLVLVGIAVSYGLFSKRNDDIHKEQGQGPINTHSYVARLLQVSSVFGDDSENPSGPHYNNTNLHTWNSQYYRGEPIVVVAKESDDATTIEKPLLLPVRSLRKESNNSRRLSRNYSAGESKENIVLRSPIPWRSRSGRMEVKEDFSQTPSMHESNPIESSPSFGYQSLDQINPSEIQSKSLEDVARRKITSFLPTPPPPPPPPPPPSHRQVKANYTHSSGKELRRSVRSIPEIFEYRRRRGAELTIRSRSDMSSAFGRTKENELEEYLSHDKEIESFIERRGSRRNKFMEEERDSKEERKEIMERGKESDESEDEEEEEEELQELASKKNGVELVDNGGPDVDKKADEFIAKFREQIRLQRIASIRRSTKSDPISQISSTKFN